MNTKNLTELENKIAQQIYGNIYQYRHAAKILASGRVYRRSSPQTHGYRDLHRNSTAAYIWNPETQQVDVICHNTTPHRAKKAIQAYQDYVQGIIDRTIWNNYVTNGWNTRQGLYARYSESELDRMGSMSKSHADYAEFETGNSTLDHINRVNMRNN